MVSFSRTLTSLRKLLRSRMKERVPFSDLFVRFQNILKNNNAAMELIADMGGKMGGDYVFDKKYLEDSVKELHRVIRDSAYDLNVITNNKNLEIYGIIEDLAKEFEVELSGKLVIRGAKTIYYLEEIEDGMEDMVGYKAYNLSKIIHLGKAKVPYSFVVATSGFRDYLAYNNLFERIGDLIEACKTEKRSAESVSDAIRLMILGGEVPPELRREVLAASKKICDAKPDSCYFSIRSSAVGEDGDLSFARLHDSFLNVGFGELLSEFKKVLASLYNQVSLEYRLRKNLSPVDMAMPVLYQTMIKSRVAGVLYTLDPNRPEASESILSCSWGLGKIVVEGAVPVDTFRLSRRPPYPIVEQRIASKAQMMVPLEKGPLQAVPRELQSKPCITPKEAALLVEVGLLLERYFKTPLDVEWSLDDGGQLWILQVRQIKPRRARRVKLPELMAALDGHPVLLKEKGVIAYRGVGAGPVWIVKDMADLSQFPAGGVLVSHYASPWLAKAIPRASAIITDIGAAIGHMATVAREFRVPTLVGTEVATEVLTPNQEVTVDAERNVIYEGRIQELLERQLLEKPAFEITHEFQLLRRLLRKIAPLSLVDPEAPNFTAKGCRTFHDIMRFIHEKAFQALVQVGKDPRGFLRRGGKRLRSHLPLNLVLIDIGGGLSEGVGREIEVDAEQIASFPMKALWEGLSSPKAWSTDPIPVDFKGFMSSLTRPQGAEASGTTLPGVNLAVIGSNYVNLSLPLGYHFTAVEAGIGPLPRNNYIFFRFVGGVTDITRRSRRAILLMTILEEIGFKVKVNGDLVIARAIDITEEQMSDYLRLTGRLIGFTRQLDVLLKNDSDIDSYLEKLMSQLKGFNHNGIIREDKNGEDDSLHSG
jgi:pyruvate,water dikinase